MAEGDPARCPVDFDHFSPEHAAAWPARWAEMRAQCPHAWTERYGGFWVVTRYRDIVAIAQRPEDFSPAKYQDPETGESRLVRLVAVDDAGTVINPELFEGQLHGGYAQGVAQALYELVQYDRDGNLVTGNFADYAIVTAAELPSFDVVDSQTPTPYNALGVKGVGESGTIGSTPAVHNAVIDALAHLGIRHLDMPVTPERVWRAIGATHA